jgi:S1-C subfamily serine protease
MQEVPIVLRATGFPNAGDVMTTLSTLSDDLSTAVAQAAPWLVAIHARRRIPSSGILLRPDVVVTAHHTIQKEEGIQVALHDGTTVAATLAGRDPTTDIAVLRLGSPATGQADFVTTGAAAVGQIIIALGRPGPSVTATMGIVSAAGGEWRTWHGGRIDQLIRLDVGIYDGFSGGALLDARGRILGMNTSGLSRSAALSLPASTVVRVAEQLLADGRVKRGFLGLGLQGVRLPPALIASIDPDDGIGVGQMVVSIEEGGPAEQAHVQLGDIVVRFDGERVAEPGDILSRLSGTAVGRGVPVQVVRGGQLLDLSITIGERPSDKRR